MDDDYVRKFKIYEEKILNKPSLFSFYDKKICFKYLQETFEKSCTEGWDNEFKYFIKLIKTINKGLDRGRTWGRSVNRCRFFSLVLKDEIYDDELMHAYFLLKKDLLPDSLISCVNISTIITNEYNDCGDELCPYVFHLDRLIDNLEDYQVNGKTLIMDTFFNEELLKIPIEVEEVILGQFFNQKIIVPENVKKITIGKNYQKPIDLQEHITHLKLNCNSSSDISGNGLIYLEAKNLSMINYLPKLETLILGKEFNQPIDNMFPNLKYLKLGHMFNQNLDNLSNSLETLIIGDENYCNFFDKPLDFLPSSLKLLCLSERYPLEINNLPPNCVVKKIEIF